MKAAEAAYFSADAVKSFTYKWKEEGIKVLLPKYFQT